MNTRNQLGCCWVHAVPSTQCWAEEKINTEQLLNSDLCPADSSNWSLLMLIRRWSVADMYSHTGQMNDRRTSRAGGSARVCQVKVNKNRMQWFYKKYIHELWNNFKIMFLNIKIQLWISHHQQYMRYQDSEILERGQLNLPWALEPHTYHIREISRDSVMEISALTHTTYCVIFKSSLKFYRAKISWIQILK